MATASSDLLSILSTTHPILASIQSLKRQREDFSYTILENITSLHGFATILDSLCDFQKTPINFSSSLYPMLFDLLFYEQTISQELLQVLEALRSQALADYVDQSGQILNEKTSILMVIDPLLHKVHFAYDNFEQEKAKYIRLCQEANDTIADLQGASHRDPLVGYDVNHTDKLQEKLKTTKKKIELVETSYFDTSEVVMNLLKEAYNTTKGIIERLEYLTQSHFESTLNISQDFTRSLQQAFDKNFQETNGIDLNNLQMYSEAETSTELYCLNVENDIAWETFAKKLRLTFAEAEEKMKIVNTEGSEGSVESRLKTYREDLRRWIVKILEVSKAKNSALQIFKLYLQDKKRRCEDLVRTLQRKEHEVGEIENKKKKENQYPSLMDSLEDILQASSDKVSTIERFIAVKLLAIDNLRAEQKACTDELTRIILQILEEESLEDLKSSEGNLPHRKLSLDEWEVEEAQEVTQKILQIVKEYHKHEFGASGTLKSTTEGLINSYRSFWASMSEVFNEGIKNLMRYKSESHPKVPRIMAEEQVSSFLKSLEKSMQEVGRASQEKQKIYWERLLPLGINLRFGFSPLRSRFRNNSPRATTGMHRRNETTPPQQGGVRNTVGIDSLDGRQTFRSLKINGQLDPDDEPLSDFTCCVQAKKAKKGRLYIFSDKVLFNAAKTQGDLMLVVPKDEIIEVEKRVSSVIFDDGIVIHTRKGELVLTSFLYRDKAFKELEELTKGNLKRKSTKTSVVLDKNWEVKDEEKPKHKRVQSEMGAIGSLALLKSPLEEKEGSEMGLVKENRLGVYSERGSKRENQKGFEVSRRQGEIQRREASVGERRQMENELFPIKDKSENLEEDHKDAYDLDVIQHEDVINILKENRENKKSFQIKKLNFGSVSQIQDQPFEDIDTIEVDQELEDEFPVEKDDNLESRRKRIYSKLSHLNKYSVDIHKEIFECTTKDLFNVWFSEKSIIFEDTGYVSFWMMLKQEQGDSNIRRSPWNPGEPLIFDCCQNEEDNEKKMQEFLGFSDCSKRSYKSEHPVTLKLPFAPNVCEVTDDQKIYWIDLHELVIEREIHLSKFPMSDCFQICECYKMKDIEDNKCEFSLSLHVDFLKNTVFKSQLTRLIKEDTKQNVCKTLSFVMERLKDIKSGIIEAEEIESQHSLRSAPSIHHSDNQEKINLEDLNDQEIKKEAAETFEAQPSSPARSMKKEPTEIIERERENVLNIERIDNKVEESKKSSHNMRVEDKEEQTQNDLLRKELVNVVQSIGGFQGQIHKEMDYMKKIMILFVGLNFLVWTYMALFR